MQKYFRLFSFLLSAVVIYGNTGAQEKTELPKDVTTWGGSELFSQPVKVFLLDGFDSDDLIEIPIAGYLSGLNKSVKGTRVKIDLPKKVIQIEIGVTEFEIPKHLLPLPEGLIPRALVATIQTPLPRGDYKVFLGNHEEGILKIQESANRNVDSELFALPMSLSTISDRPHLVNSSKQETTIPSLIATAVFSRPSGVSNGRHTSTDSWNSNRVSKAYVH